MNTFPRNSTAAACLAAFRLERGSILITVAAFATLLTFAIGGFLGVARNVVNQEIGALNDDKAFLSAESGLLAGARWVLSHYSPSNFLSKADLFGQSLRGENAVNGIDVTVNIDVDGSKVTVTSIARNPASMHYEKRISWTLDMVPSNRASGSFGVYLDNAYRLGGNTKGIRKMDWDGPAHFNTALQLGNPGNGNETHFNGPVTLYNIDPATGLQVFDPNNGTGHYGNDYRYGVSGGSGNWNSEFQGTYDPHSDRHFASFDCSGKVDLAMSAGDSGLTFGVSSGTPYFRFRNASGNLVTVTYDPTNEIKLHIVNKGVAVSGTVKGKVLVYTDPGKSMYLPGDLRYPDFSTSSFSNPDTASNSGYGFDSANVLGLYSGGDFRIAEGTHYITGQLFAVSAPENTLVYDNDKKNKTEMFLFGCLAVSGFWDSKQGNDQATFEQRWDRRAVRAPGLGYNTLNGAGETVYTCVFSKWTDLNIP